MTHITDKEQSVEDWLEEQIELHALTTTHVPRDPQDPWPLLTELAEALPECRGLLMGRDDGPAVSKAAFEKRADEGFTDQQRCNIAREMTSGDLIRRNSGGMRGTPHTVDLEGRSKQDVYRAARKRDLGYFARMSYRLNKGAYPANRRVWQPKLSGGYRPISIPSMRAAIDAKLFEMLIASAVLGELLDSQFAYRDGAHLRSLDVAQRIGVGPNEHMAVGLHDAINAGHHWVVQADLIDAFGQVGHHAIKEALRSLKALKGGETPEALLSAEQIRRIVQLVRINDIDGHGRCYRKGRKGMIQGSVLSVLLLPLVLAPVLRELEDLGVKTYSYADDLYMAAASKTQAIEAFKRLREVLKARGVGKVRLLGNDGKASRLIDARVQPVTVVSTYLVTRRYIGLVDEKVDKLRQEYRGPMTPRAILKKTPYKALTSQWIRKVFLGRGSMSLDTPTTTTPRPLSQGGPLHAGGPVHRHGGQPTPIQGEAHRTPPGGQDLNAQGAQGHEVSGELVHHDDQGTRPLPWTAADVGGDAPMDAVARGDADVLPVQGDDQQALGCGDDDQGEPDSLGEGSILLTEVVEHDDGTNTGNSGRFTSRGGVYGRAATLSQARRTAGGGGSGSETKATSNNPVFLTPLNHTNLISDLRDGAPLRRGEAFKTTINTAASRVLDIRGLGEALGQPRLLDQEATLALLRLLKTARLHRRVWVAVDPREQWVHTPGILGDPEDGQYRCLHQEHVEDKLVLELVLRRRRQPPCRSRPTTTSPKPNDACLGLPRRSQGQPRMWSVLVSTTRGDRRVQVSVEDPCRDGGLLAAVVAVVNEVGHGSTVVLPNIPILATVLLPMEESGELCRLRSPAWADARAALMKRRRWEQAPRGLVGRPR